MFVDHLRIYAKAGDGGSGCVSFRRESHVPRGGPDGGDGGQGGNVILQAEVHQDSLASLFYDPKVIAQDGGRGKGKQMSGKSGSHHIVKLPVGTLVYRVPTDTTAPVVPGHSIESKVPSKIECVVDLAKAGQGFILCRGGRGGKGNIHFKSARNQAPTKHSTGEPGEEGTFYLELRMLADVGLVGFPNAGKSTLLSKLTAAHPKVAPYPFTTLRPSVGVMDLSDYKTATVADIPGLTEGAHQHVGLGHQFLRHITRCQLLIYVLDMGGVDGRNALEDFAVLKRELRLYDASLLDRPSLVVANKLDLPSSTGNLKKFCVARPELEVIPISAERTTGLDNLRQKIGTLLEQLCPAS